MAKAKTLWKKNQASPNPNGRPIDAKSMRQVWLKYFDEKAPKEKDKSRLEKVMETLYTNAINGDTVAAKYIIDQNIGKPKETIDANFDGNINVIVKQF